MVEHRYLSHDELPAERTEWRVTIRYSGEEHPAILVYTPRPDDWNITRRCWLNRLGRGRHNPTRSSHRIEPGTRGIIILDGPEDARRVADTCGFAVPWNDEDRLHFERTI